MAKVGDYRLLALPTIWSSTVGQVIAIVLLMLAVIRLPALFGLSHLVF